MENKPKPDKPELYEKAKQVVLKRYKNKRSPFVSGAIVLEYKKLGGTYTGSKDKTKLKRWFDEKWVNVNPVVGRQDDAYAFFRPTVRVSEKTPALLQDIKGNLTNYVSQKQNIKYGNQIPDIDIKKKEIKGKGKKVIMEAKDYFDEHKKLINLLNLGNKLIKEAKEQSKEVKKAKLYDDFKPHIIGGMLVQSQPYSKNNF